MGKNEAKRKQIDAFSDIILIFGIIMLRKMTGDNGMAYLFAAYVLYHFVWVLTGRGAASVIAKMLKGRGQRNQYRNFFSVKGRMLLVQLLSGIVGCVLLSAAGSLIIDHVFGMENGIVIVMIFVPALFFRNLTESYSGFIRGGGKNLTAAVVGVLRSISYIGLSFLFGNMFREYGLKVGALLMQERVSGMYAAMGAVIAVNVTELILFLILFAADRFLTSYPSAGTRMTEPFGEIAVNMYLGRADQILIGLLMTLPFFTGMSIYTIHEKQNPDFVNQLGMLAGIFLAVLMVLYKLQQMMIFPMIAQTNTYNRKSDLRLEKMYFENGLHAMSVWGFFFAMLLLTLSEEWAKLLWADKMEQVSRLYTAGAVVILFAGLSDYFGRLLFILDKKIVLLGNLGVMNIVFVIVLAITLKQMENPFDALIFSLVLSSGILCIAECGCLIRITGIGIDWFQTVGIPAAAALISGIVVHFMAQILDRHIGSLLTAVLCVTVSLILYFVMLLCVKNIREPELKFFPGGKVIGFFLHLFSE